MWTSLWLLVIAAVDDGRLIVGRASTAPSLRASLDTDRRTVSFVSGHPAAVDSAGTPVDSAFLHARVLCEGRGHRTVGGDYSQTAATAASKTARSWRWLQSWSEQSNEWEMQGQTECLELIADCALSGRVEDTTSCSTCACTIAFPVDFYDLAMFGGQPPWKAAPHSYVTSIYRNVQSHCQAPNYEQRSYSMLVIGLGTGKLVDSVARRCPGVGAQGEVVAVDYDKEVHTLAMNSLGYQDSSSVQEHVHSMVPKDGGLAVKELRSQRPMSFDSVLVDVFIASANGVAIPESCRNDAFVGGLFELLRTGSLLQHFVHPQHMAEMVPRYQKIFGGGAVHTDANVPSLIVVRKG